MKFKVIKKFVEALPLILEYAKKVWDIITEITNYEEELKESK